MNDDDQENLDASEFLPRGAPVVNAHRAAKGDLRIELHDDRHGIRFAQAQCSTLMNHLENIGTIDAQNCRDGQTYEVWQTIFRARQGYRNNPIYGDELARMKRLVVDDELPCDDFTKLVRSLGYHTRAIETAIYTPAGPHETWRLNHMAYRVAFEALSARMGAMREERRKNREENSCIEIIYL